jgi:two-component system OmpR family sensor kinase
MFTNSIRWRLQLWLAFLLLCVLSGFAVTVYQLQRVNQFKQIDDELERRVAVLINAVRGGAPPEFGPGGPRGEGGPFRREGGPGQFDGPRRFEGGPGRMDQGPGGPGRPDFDFDNDEPMRRPPPRGRPGQMPFGGPRQFRLGPREVRLSPEASSLFDETRTNAFYFAAWGRAGMLLKSSTNAPTDVAMPDGPPDTLTHVRMRDDYREAFHFTEMGDCVLAGRSIAADLKALGRFRFLLLAAGGTVLAFGMGGGWWLTTSAIRPVEEISVAASRISAGNLSERITGADSDNELGRLAGVLNSTFARLESAFAQQRQFTADASHELRTPLAVMISEAQTALARKRDAAEYRETVEGCLETAQQMRRLTESLLQLARLDAGQEQIQRCPCDLAEKTRACVELIRPLAQERGLRLECDLAPVTVLGDSDRLGQLVTNLLSNAIHYNKDNGEIRVSIRIENGDAVLTVSDTGSGIAPEELPRVFERFYRADKARSRSAGRTGLGLAICKAIVDAHGAAIQIESELDQGTTFTVRIPTSTT